MQKNIYLFYWFFIFVNLFSGAIDNEKEIQKVSEQIIDEILQALNSNNYELYSKRFDEKMKSASSKKKFEQDRETIINWFGNYVSRIYFGYLIKNNNIVVLWKGCFDKETEDILIKLVLSKVNNEYMVSGIWFQ